MDMDQLRRGIETFYCWYGGLILCFFAFVPIWIGFHAILDAVSDPHTIDGQWFTAVLICSALTYFLLLLAYRAFTGRGRKQDGGLLPPLALQAFAVLFGATGVLISGFGDYNTKPAAIVGGLTYFLAAATLFRVARCRRTGGAGATDSRG
jgi:hypothetical protein